MTEAYRSKLTFKKALDAILLGGEGSGNFGHAGREGEVGGSAAAAHTGKSVQTKVTPALATVAQSVYDAWDENEDEYAGGGICHLIAEEMVGKLDEHGIEAATVSAQQGEQHVWVVAKLDDGVYSIDIPPGTYERGGGYSWTKKQGVQITKDDVVVDRIDADPSKFEDYLDMSVKHAELGERKQRLLDLFVEALSLGGSGSGNFGHAGRKGEVGGSAPEGAGATFFERNTRLSPFRSIPVVRSIGTPSHNPEADVHGGKIHLYPKFDKLPPEVQDYVFAHEVGHAVLDEQGLSALIADAGKLGIDAWDTDALPYGEANMHEAFAEAFASFHTDKEVVTRYPAWAKLVENYATRFAKKKDLRHDLIGNENSGNHGHEGRPGQVGGSAPKDGSVGTLNEHGVRTFEKNEGYEWHERPEMVAHVEKLPYEEAKAVQSYASFDYGEVNQTLRGTFTVPMIDEFVRAATPEEIAQYKNPGSPDRPWHDGKPTSYDPGDPTNTVADGRIVKNAFTTDPKTGEKVFHSIQRAVPDQARIDRIQATTDRINNAIAEHGYVLKEPIEVNRAAYVPGLSYDDVKAMEGQTIEEKGFTSTMVGDPSGRLDSYVTHGKSESLYKRFADKEGSEAIYKRQDEVGASMRIKVVLPEGTKVAPVEAIRRTEYEFPKTIDTEAYEDYKRERPNEKVDPEDFRFKRDYTAKPTVVTKSLTDPDDYERSRTEAEVLLGSGAKFRVTSVQRAPRRIVSSDPKMKPIEVIDVALEYIGGGSSEATAKKDLRLLLQMGDRLFVRGTAGMLHQAALLGDRVYARDEAGLFHLIGNAEFREQSFDLYGTKSSGHWGHSSVKGQRGGSAPGEGDPVEAKRDKIHAMLKESDDAVARVDVMRDGVNAAWQVWAKDINERKKPLKADGAAAKKLDSYKAAKALETEFHAEIDKLRAGDSALNRAVREMLKVPPEQQSKVTFNDDQTLHPALVRSAKDSLALLRQYDGSGSFQPTKFPAEMADKVREVFADKDTPLITNDDGTVSLPHNGLKLGRAESGRAHTTFLGGIKLGGGRELDRQVWHEVAHHIEMENWDIKQAAIAFRESKANQPREVYKLKTVNPALDDHEEALRGNFRDPYIGKVYPDDIATEIVSTGVEAYLHDPVQFARDDIDHFNFTYDVLHGKYRKDRSIKKADLK